MSRGSNDKVTVENLTLHVETDAAYGVMQPGGEETVWIPKSMAEDIRLEKGVEGSVVIPRWLADKKDLEYSE